MRRERKNVWRNRWSFHTYSTNLDWTITRAVPGLWAMKHIKFRQSWIILQSLIKGGKKSKQYMTVIFSVASDISFVLFPLKKLGRTQTSWRVFCRDLTVKCVFWGNATCHPETLQARLTNIKLVFPPRNLTLRLQPLDACINRNFKHKYRKLLVCYVVSRWRENGFRIKLQIMNKIL